MPPTATPRSRRPRPASAAVASSKRLLSGENVDTNMIQAVYEHLAYPSPRRRRRDNQEDGDRTTSQTELVRLVDHMDGFPLVPLPVIPQLSIDDLEKVELGLNELLGSLMPYESDEQLGRYATRQLALVQRHLTQQRAQERVFQMLSGDLPVGLAPIGANILKKSSSASAVVKSGSSSSSAHLDNHKNAQSSLPQTKNTNEAASLHWKSKKAAVEMARAMVQANATKKTTVNLSTSFMVSSGDNASRKRRRPRKRTPEEEAKHKAEKLERERENRRQAAYQRLVARRELQEKKKQAAGKGRKKDGSGDKNGKQKEKEPDDSDSDDESETSDVSNCSESDEANEKAIHALDVQISTSVDGVGDSPRSERSESDDDDGDDKQNGSATKTEDDDVQEAPECESSRSEIYPGTVNTDDQVPESSIFPQFDGVPVVDYPSSIGSGNTEDVRVIDTAVHPQETARTNEVEEKQQQNDQEETNIFTLQNFMAARAAAKIQQLQAEKDAQERKNVRTIASASPPDKPSINSASKSIDDEQASIDVSPPRPGTGDDEDTAKCDESFLVAPMTDTVDSAECFSTEPSATNGSSTPPSNMSAMDKKQPSWIEEVRQSVVELKAKSPARAESDERITTLPRVPAAECKDYRFYFSNFHCILTSVFEQSRSNSSNPSSSTSLYRRPVGANGEHTMRLQQKLYESWQSIMQDYATVFGPKIVAPEGMVPMAAAKPWAPHYRINSTARNEVSEIVTQALQRLGGDWEDHPSGLGLKTSWNLLWTWSKPRVERQTLLAWQKVNHFQHAKALTRKDCLKKHIGKYLAAGGRLRQAFDIIPQTFLLPKEYVAFVQAFQERNELLKRSGFSGGKNIWIMKPVALSRGRGISLVNDLSQVIYGEQVVIQEYIAAPRLLDGFKFDLRLYVLVTSFNPLEAFLYDEGFVRLCTRPYEDSDLSNMFVHLTNSSIQKDNEEAIVGSANPIASAIKEENTSNGKNTKEEGEAAQKDAGGTKTTLAYLWRRLAAEGIDVEQVKRSIDEVVIKALLCGEDQIPFQVNSFDLLGYDILLDADLRPWLIEINSSPSMARDHDLDYQVKDAMMLDTLRVVDPLHFDRAKLAEIIARRQRDVEDEKRRPHAHTRHPREAEELAARQLNEDLTTILRGKVPRAYGEIPENIGNYRRLCPHTAIYNQLVKLKRSCLRVGERK